MEDEHIVESWLKSLNLVNYAQSFVDNGYDDLEICKQIGDPDLDAIGVEEAEDRQKIIDAIKDLKQKGGTTVYFTLNDEDEATVTADATRASRDTPVAVRPTLDALLNDVQSPATSVAQTRAVPDGESATQGLTTQGSGQAFQDQGQFVAQTELVIYPKMKLTIILRDKVFEDRVDLAGPPYTAPNLAPCWSSLTALAIKYATELQTCIEDVLDRLEDIRWWQVTEDNVSVYTPPSVTSSTLEDPYYPSQVYAYSPRGGPPPIPSVPPPDGSHMDGYGQLHSIQTRYSDVQAHANYVTLDTGMCCVFPKKKVKGESELSQEKKKTSTLGRLFRNMGFRKSSRKHAYKKHQGDLLAHEITMGDNDRIALMQMVKEGKISTETALQVVKKFEEERRKDEPCPETPTKDKDKKGTKSKKSASLKPPTKSPSINYSESPCEACNTIQLGGYPATFGGGHQCRQYSEEGCRHRRVHSVSHIAYPDPLRSPGTGRAMSCSPMRSNSSGNSAVNSPVGNFQGTKIYTPVIPHELKMYSGARGLYAVHGIDMIKDRLSVIKTGTCVHKTQSKASLISSESDHSMECSGHLLSQQEGQDDMYYPSNVSSVSMGSDTLPSMNGRRKCGSTMEKLRNHKWQRTGSVSQVEDGGMSTDTDDIDVDPDRHLLAGSAAVNSGSGAASVMEKFRGVKNEMRKRILHTRDIIGDGKSQHLCSAYQTVPGANQSVSSTDSCSSSGIGSQSSQAWNDLEVTGGQCQGSPGQGHPAVGGQWSGPVLGIARVHSNYSPSAEEKDFLHLRRGERVQVLEAANTGIWKGRVDNRVGFFHFNYVDMITETTPVNARRDKAPSRRRMNRRSKPRSVEELLQRIGLEHLTPVFIMNGYDNLEIFAEIDHDDLNALNILDSESRTKLITAADLLTDYDDTPQDTMSRVSRSASATPTSQQYSVPWTSFFPSKPSTGSRDSGCYDSNECMNHGDPYSSLCRHNKENVRPPFTGKRLAPVPVPQTGLPPNSESKLNGAKVSNGAKGENGGQEEKIYSEEDQEVCHITGYQSSKVNRTSPRQSSLVNGHDRVDSASSNSSDVHSHYRCLNIPILGPDWKVFSDCCSQTSPYGPLDDSFDGDSSVDLLTSPGMSSSVHGDIFSQSDSTLRKKSKPYARKISTTSGPLKDAQVQVMCPLGNLQLQSPSSPLPVNRAINQSALSANQSVPIQKTQTGSSTPVQSTNFQNMSTFKPTQSDSKNQTNQKEPQGKPENVATSRVSYASQNSREGDSGSDASTVKSESEPGRSTPDSIYGPIHRNFKSIKRSVIPKVTTKLAAENIDLSVEPYTSPDGGCGIPPLLVQRYSEELKLDVFKTAIILDQVRIHKLTSVGRPVIPADQLKENSMASSELKIATIQEFFISIGLPMYTDFVLAKGHNSVEAIASLPVKEIQAMTKAERKHLKRIIHALEWVQNRLKSPSRKAKTSPVKDKV